MKFSFKNMAKEIKKKITEVAKEAPTTKETAPDTEHEKRLARLNPPFDPDLPESKQRHFR